MVSAEISKGHCMGIECRLLQNCVNELELAEGSAQSVDDETQLINACMLTNGCIAEKKRELRPVKLAEYAVSALARHEDEEVIRAWQKVDK